MGNAYLEEAARTARQTPQTEPMRSDQVPNSAGGYSWPVDDWTQLDRFLILGSEGGSFYATEQTLTRENAKAVERCLDADLERTVGRIVEISQSGRAPKNSPAIFALALACSHGGRKNTAAFEAVPQVCRTGTHIFEFCSYVKQMRGWGRGLRRAVASWYESRKSDGLAYQAIKYRQRHGFMHRDLLRLAHPAAPADGNAGIYDWICGRDPGKDLPPLIEGYERAQAVTRPREWVELIREYDLPREALPPEALRSPDVWEALLAEMPMTAMIRNLGVMSARELLTPGSAAAHTVVGRLGDAERLASARIHPIQLLMALYTYRAGRGMRGSLTWVAVPQVIDALDDAFYAAFGNVKPSGARTLVAVDVSGSMGWGDVNGIPGLTPRSLAGALSLVIAATEPNYEIVAFSHELTPIPLSPKQRLDDAVEMINRLSFGATDCALPMQWARANKREIDLFVILTDNETWYGRQHPAEALRNYRRTTEIPARLAVLAMVSNGFSIADPEDAGMLDLVGFDAAMPRLISDFGAPN